MYDAIKHLYNEIIETRGELVCKLDKNSILLVVNDAYASTFGRTKEDMVGMRFLDLLPKADHLLVLDQLADLTMRKPEISFEHMVLDPSGKELWHEWHVRAVYDTNKQLEYLISFGRDISDHRGMERDLKRQNELKSLLMDVAISMGNIPVNDLDKAINETISKIGSFAGVDRSYVFMYDFNNNLMNNTHEWCNQLIPSEIDKLQGLPIDLFPQWIEAHLNGRVYHVPLVADLPEQDHAKVILEQQGIKTLITVPLMKGEDCLGFVGFDSVKEHITWTDTERGLLKMLAELIANAEVRRRFESEIIEARFEAEAANDAKSQFLTSISHEIRTPLNGIIGMVEVLQKSNLTAEQQRYLNIIDSSSGILQQIIQDLLGLNNTSLPAIELDEVTFNMAALIQEVSDLMKVKAIAKGITLEIMDISLPFTYFAGARLRIKQVLMNLLNNAIKFTDKGLVRIKVSLTQYNQESKAAYIRFDIIDTGIGIDQVSLNNLFKPFFQSDSSSRAVQRGKGLGLLICKNLVNSMKGRIGIASLEGKGSRAWFVIPLLKGDFREEYTMLGNTNTELAGKHALIIGKDDMSSVFLKKQLQTNDFSYDSLTSLAEAGEMISSDTMAQVPYATALIDTSLGLTEVLTFVDTLKNDAFYYNMRVVLISSKKDQLSRQQLNQHDISDMLVRPVRSFEIERILLGTNSKATAPSRADTTLIQPETDKFDKDQFPVLRFTGKVLVAEDNRINQMLITLILSKMNVAHTIVENGLKAVQEVTENDYRVVFMDCRMPIMDGFHATQKIRELSDKTRAQIHIVAVTAHVIEGYRENCLAAGMNDYISKPFRMNDITRILLNLEDDPAVIRSIQHVDIKRIKERFGNNDEFVTQLIERFIEETELLLLDLNAAYSKAEYSNAYDINHSIKGAAVNIEADSIYKLALVMQRAIEEKDRPLAHQTLQEMADEAGSMKAWFKSRSFP